MTESRVLSATGTHSWRVALPLATVLYGGVAFACLFIWHSVKPERSRGPIGPVYSESVASAAFGAWYFWLAVLPFFILAVYLTVTGLSDRRSSAK